MTIHIPAFKAMAKSNAHLDHDAFDFEISDEVLSAAGYEKVVRCKGCKNRFTTHCPMHHEEQTYNEDDGYGWIERDHTSDDGFCDEGELATDDNL